MTSRLSLTFAAVLCLALALAAPTPSAASCGNCTYDFTFSRTASGDVQVVVVADCGFYTPYRTHLSVFPGFGSASAYGDTAQVTVTDSPGSQLYCANAYATYWCGPNLAISLDDQECQSF